MPITPHQSQYFAWQLARKATQGSLEFIASTLIDAEVDLNPAPSGCRAFYLPKSLI